jgi:hypothetical protein
MTAAEVELKSPFVPLFQRRNVTKMGSRKKKSQVRHSKKLRFSVPLFEKEGKGRFSDGMMRELCSELQGHDTSVFLNNALSTTATAATLSGNRASQRQRCTFAVD